MWLLEVPFGRVATHMLKNVGLDIVIHTFFIHNNYCSMAGQMPLHIERRYLRVCEKLKKKKRFHFAFA